MHKVEAQVLQSSKNRVRRSLWLGRGMDAVLFHKAIPYRVCEARVLRVR